MAKGIYRLFHTAAALLLGSGASLAVVIDSGTSDTNWRFDTDRNGATFVAEGLDLSGVGLSASNTRWATLVSRNVVVSAYHYRPDFDGGSSDNIITFYSTNDPTGPSHSSTISNAYRIPGSDVFLGVLDNPVPASGYSTYSVISEPITSAAEYASSSLAYLPDPPGPNRGNQVNAYTIGNQTSSGATNQWVGRNVIDRWFDEQELTGVIDDALALDYGNALLSSSAPSVTYESRLEGGDSGSPLFIEDQGELLLTGVAWFVYSVDEQPAGSAYSYLGNYSDEIQNFIELNAIPEPSAISLLIGSGLVLGLRRRRKTTPRLA